MNQQFFSGQTVEFKRTAPLYVYNQRYARVVTVGEYLNLEILNHSVDTLSGIVEYVRAMIMVYMVPASDVELAEYQEKDQ